MRFKTVKKTIEVPDNLVNGSQVRELRKSRKVSLRTLAKKLGISAPYLTDLELGRRGISKERFGQAIEALF